MAADPIQPLFEHFRLRAQTFFLGNLCAVASFDRPGHEGHLHLVKDGKGEIRDRAGRTLVSLDGPAVVYFPRLIPHHLVPDPERGLDLVCASITFGRNVDNPLAQALPQVVTFDRSPAVTLLFEEAFGTQEGRQAVVDRLCEVVLVQVLRQALGAGKTEAGLLAGLAHPQLQGTLTALHADPARPWSVEDMAAEAGVSRSTFMPLFKQVVGRTPADYLARYRVALAQERLSRGVPLKVVAYDVGYGSPTALSRAFRELTGRSPRAWLKAESD